MAKIKKIDLIDSNPFLDLKKSADEAKASVVFLEKALESVKAASKVVKSAAPTEVSGAKDVKSLNDAQEKANQLAKNKMLIDKELAKERLKLQQLNKEYNTRLKEEIALENKQIGTLERLNVENAQLRRERAKLNLETKEGTQRMREINVLIDKNTKLIKESADEQKRQTLNVGNYGSALDGLKGKLLSVGDAVGIGIGVGIGGAIAGLFSMNKELDKATNTAQQFFGTSRDGAKALAQEATIVGKVWGKETNEVLAAANVLTKEFGISGEQAIERINAGFNKGADVQGEFIQNIKEYSSQLSYAGLNAEQTIALITQSQNQGVFSDKGVDSIKEAALSLREMTQPAKDALAAIGMSGDEVLKQINSGQKTYFEVIQEISAKTAEFGQGSQQAGMILADVFKGAGEDAGRFIFSLDEMNLNMDEMEDTSKGMDAALGKLTTKFYEFIFGVNDAGGVTDKFAVAINWLADNLGTIFSTIGKLIVAFGTYKTIMFSIKMADRVKEFTQFNKAVKDGAEGMQGASGGAKAFGAALKGIGLTVAIQLVIDFAMALYDVASGAQRARFEMDMFNEATAKGADKATASLNKVKNALQDEINAIRLRGLSEQEEQRLIAEATERTQKRIQNTVKTLYNAREATADQLEIERERLGNLEKLYGNIADLDPFTRVKLEEQKNVISNLRAEYKAQNAAIEALKVGAKDLNQEVVDLNVAQIKNTTTTKEDKKAHEELKEVIDNEIYTWKEYNAWREEVNRTEQERREALEMPDFGLPIYTPDPTAEDIEDPDKRFQFDRQYIDLATDYFIKRADERIAKIDEEMKMAEERADLYRKLAAEGNATAKESLAEQDRIIAENNLKKEQEEKRKQRILLVSSILQAYNSNLQSGDSSTEAFTKAITSSGVLQQFIAALPAFEKGTEDTGLNGYGVDGRGGMLSVLHPNERVMTKEQNIKMGAISNEDAANIIHNYRYGKLVDAQIGGAWESALVVKQLMSVKGELSEVKKAIMDKPEHTAEIINATASGFTLLHREKRPFKTITKRYKS